MRCPFCHKNFTLQGPFCPNCGRRIIGPHTGEVADESTPSAPPAPSQPGEEGPSQQTPAPPPTSQPSAPSWAPGPPPVPAPEPAPGPRGMPPPPTPAQQAPPPPPFAQQGGAPDDVLVVDLDLSDTGPSGPSAGAWGPPLVPSTPRQRPMGGPASQPVDKEHLSRTCPYCRFPLKTNEHMTVCPACGVAHHSDCWQENGGCTTYACRYSPESHPPDAAPPPRAGYAGAPSYGPSAGAPPTGPIFSGSMLHPDQATAVARLERDANNALIVSLLGLFCCGIASIFGGIMALTVLVRARSRGVSSPGIRNRAIAALILGVGLPLVGIIWGIVMYHSSGLGALGGAGGFGRPGGY